MATWGHQRVSVSPERLASSASSTLEGQGTPWTDFANLTEMGRRQRLSPGYKAVTRQGGVTLSFALLCVCVCGGVGIGKCPGVDWFWGAPPRDASELSLRGKGRPDPPALRVHCTPCLQRRASSETPGGEAGHRGNVGFLCATGTWRPPSRHH